MELTSMLAAGVTYFEPEDSGFQHFVQDTYGQLVDAGSGSAQQAAATGFQPVHFAAASTGEFHCFAWYSQQFVMLHTSK